MHSQDCGEPPHPPLPWRSVACSQITCPEEGAWRSGSAGSTGEECLALESQEYILCCSGTLSPSLSFKCGVVGRWKCLGTVTCLGTLYIQFPTEHPVRSPKSTETACGTVSSQSMCRTDTHKSYPGEKNGGWGFEERVRCFGGI